MTTARRDSPTSAGGHRTRNVRLPLDDTELAAIRTAAAEQGLALVTYIRRAALARPTVTVERPEVRAS